MKILILLIVSLFLCMIMTPVKCDSMPIGGSWSFQGPILDLYRGKKRVVVLTPGAGTTRRAAESSGRSIVSRFANFGITAEWIDLAPPNCQAQANNPEIAKKILDSDAVFIGGGFSDVYQQCFFGNAMSGSSLVSEALKEVKKTRLIGGSSAGAMVQPGKDILMTRRSVSSYQAVTGVNIPSMDGSDLFSTGLVDSHFSERARQGRLFVHAFQKKARFSFGVDEDSGLVENEKTKEKLFLGGRGTVVFDHINMDLENGRVHYLTHGDKLLPDGSIVYPAWKTPCRLTSVAPAPSQRIFSDFKERSFKVALFDQNTLYSGLEGRSPVVEVQLQKLSETQVMCGEFEGKGYISFSNMFVSMATRSKKQLKGRVGLESVNLEPFYVDNM